MSPIEESMTDSPKPNGVTPENAVNVVDTQPHIEHHHSRKGKKKPATAMKKVVTLLKRCGLAFAIGGIAAFYYMPLIAQLLIGSFVLSIIAVIYLPPKVKHRWEVKFMVAQGWTLRQWLFYLARHNFAVDPIYWHRALFITLLSTLSSFAWLPKEDKEYPEEVIRATEIKHSPVFILGHFRSGTTRLHELMSKDDRFAAPTVYQCFAPRVFLHREERIAEQFGKLQIRRPMDSVKVRMESPQEDEFGLVNMCGLSPYMGAIFARVEAHTSMYLKYLSFKQATLEEIARWKDAVVFFYKKVLFKRQDKRLILKSPAHTARLKLLLELFPTAKFIHISRNPYEVYQSSLKLFADLLIQWNLQYVDYMGTPVGAKRRHGDDNVVHNSVLSLFGTMYDSFFQDLQDVKLKKDQLCYVKYEDLMQSPVRVVEQIYRDLQLDNFEKVHPLLVEATADDAKFRKNTHPTISSEVQADIRQRVGAYFSEFGYDKDGNATATMPVASASS